MNNQLTNIFDKVFSKGASLSTNLDAYLCRLGDKRKNRIILFTLIVLVVTSVLFVLNVLTPLSADDLIYGFQFGKIIPITNFSDIIESQYEHYMRWGGRSVVHTILQAILQLSSFVIDILNTLVYLLYTALVYWLIKGRGKHSISLYVLINFAIWFIMPAYGDTILWITGSVNYLWGTGLILLFILPFRFYQGREIKRGKQIVYSSFFFLFGIIAGWTNENTAGAMILLSILFVVMYRIQQWKIPAWAIAGIVGALIGYAIMILAPGNATRAEEAGGLSFLIVVYRLLMHSLTLFNDYGVLILVYLVLLILHGRFSNEKSNSFTLMYSLLFFVAMLAGIYAMIFSPSFPPRAWFGVLTFLIIAIGIVFYNLDFKEAFIRKIRMVTIGVATVVFCFTFYLAIRDAYDGYKVSIERQQLVKEAKERGDENCYFKRYISKTKFVHSEDPDANFIMTPYYGIYILFE